MSAAKEPTKRLVVHGVGEARPMLPRSITLASSSLTPASFNKEFRNSALNPMPPKLEHAVDPKSDDRVMKNVPVPEPYRLARNALFDDNGVPVIPLIRSHFVKEGLSFLSVHLFSLVTPLTRHSLFLTGRLSVDCAMELIRRTKEILVQEPNIVTVHPPTVGLSITPFFCLLQRIALFFSSSHCALGNSGWRHPRTVF